MPTLYWEQRPFFILRQFPSLENFFIWTLGGSSSSQVDVAVVNDKYSSGKLAYRAGTGERLTGTPLVQPSL